MSRRYPPMLPHFSSLDHQPAWLVVPDEARFA
jgi:hypothetical protein